MIKVHLPLSMEIFQFHDTVVDVRLMQTAYAISETRGSVPVCVDISSAQLARNVSVTLRSVAAGTAVGKPFESFTHNACVPDAMYTYRYFRKNIRLRCPLSQF